MFSQPIDQVLCYHRLSLPNQGWKNASNCKEVFEAAQVDQRGQ